MSEADRDAPGHARATAAAVEDPSSPWRAEAPAQPTDAEAPTDQHPVVGAANRNAAAAGAAGNGFGPTGPGPGGSGPGQVGAAGSGPGPSRADGARDGVASSSDTTTTLPVVGSADDPYVNRDQRATGLGRRSGGAASDVDQYHALAASQPTTTVPAVGAPEVAAPDAGSGSTTTSVVPSAAVPASAVPTPAVAAPGGRATGGVAPGVRTSAAPAGALRSEAPTTAPPPVAASGLSGSATATNVSSASTARAATSTSSGARRPKNERVPRRARLQLRHLNVWSVLKFSCVLAIALFFVWLIMVGVLYGLLDLMGVFTRVNDTVAKINDTTSKDVVSPSIVFGGAFLIGLVNIVLFIALSTIGSVVYNLCADLVGGIEVTLAEREI